MAEAPAPSTAPASHPSRQAPVESEEAGPKDTLQSTLQLSKKNHLLFFNREISWLQFNYRVLEEAARKDNPLLERLKFLAIFESNLIEFYMIRAAGLKQMKASSYSELQLDGRSPLETLQEISRITRQHLSAMSRHRQGIFAGLAANGIHILESRQELLPREKRYLNEYSQSELFRIVTPLAIDPGHPFPHIVSAHLYLAILLRRQKSQKDIFVIVEVPGVLPRFIELPPSLSRRKREATMRRFIALEEVVKMNIGQLFPGAAIRSAHEFAIIRNNEMAIDEVASDNLLSTIEGELKNRRWGEAVCLYCQEGMPVMVQNFLQKELSLEKYEMHQRHGLLNMQDFWQLYELFPARSPLRDRPFIPRNALNLALPEKIFEAIRKRDYLLYHPYDSFQSVADLLYVAARDPKVLAIKQTLYRTGTQSPIVEHLIKAAENGKQVTALVELKARFDEERNINWAREMESHGVHVVYGLLGLKIHCKMLQIVRREAKEVRTYVHLATGNYNPLTSRIYTDFGLMTARPDINTDITNLFHALTGVALQHRFRKIAVAPVNLRQALLRLIHREIVNAEAGRQARICLKMNALVDPEMILALYRASRAGVEIDLNVRGICCLRPGIAGVSENIRVVSIVGRFLEHSRIFYFENGGQPQVYLSSADLMPRNLNLRVEVMFPVEDRDHVEQLISILEVTFRDNHNLRRLAADGTYRRIKPHPKEQRFSSQRFFREQANRGIARQGKDKAAQRRSLFQPLTNPEGNSFATLLSEEEADNSDAGDKEQER